MNYYDTPDCDTPPEMTGKFISGHEISLAQKTLFSLYKLPKNKQRIVVEVYYDGRENGHNSNRIKQDLFDELPGYDNYFLIDIMRSESYAEEKSVFVDYLSEWVTESKTVKQVKKLFSHKYFKKHPEIKKEILEYNYSFGLKDKKIIKIVAAITKKSHLK